MNQQTKKITVYDMVMVALFAAVCYVATNFRIEIPTPIGKTMIHFGNIFCLLAGLLMGGFRGGAAAGIGSFFFDLLGGWATSAPSTLIFKFVMGFLAGTIAHRKGKQAKHLPTNIMGAAIGMYSYVVLYLGYSLVKGLMLGNAFATVLSDISIKALTSTISGTFSIVVVMLLLPVFQATLGKVGFFKKVKA